MDLVREHLIAIYGEDAFRCRCGQCGLGIADMRDDMLRSFLALTLGMISPVTITSAIRCQAHNQAVGGKSDSRHLISSGADAIDFLIADEFRYPGGLWKVQHLAILLGFRGFGRRMHGPRDKWTFHMDWRGGRVIEWTYP